MIFAKRVFQVAAIWGIAIVVLGYAAFLLGLGGEEAAVITNHPEYVHGFFVAVFAWQIAFLLIASDPARYRLLMLAAMLEKFPFTLATLILYANGAVAEPVLVFGLIDGALGLLFYAAYVVTGRGDEV
jgi:hypothetical protein